MSERLRLAHYWFALLAVGSYYVAALSYLRIYYAAVVFAAWLSVLVAFAARDQAQHLLEDSVWIVAMFCYFAITGLWADDPSRTLTAVAVDSIYILVWLVAYVLAYNNSERALSNLFVALPYVVACVYGYLLARYGTVRPIDEETVQAMGAVANVASVTLAICLPFVFWRALGGEPQRLIELILIYLMIGVSQSRSGILLAFFCTCMSLAAGRFLLKGAQRTALLAGIALLAALFIALLIPDFRSAGHNVLQRLDPSPLAVSVAPRDAPALAPALVTERDAMLSIGWKTFTENPILGIGYHNLGPRVEREYGKEVVSHNLFLTFVVESGWPALLLLWLGVLFALSRLIHSIRTRPLATIGYYQACLIALLAMLLLSMVHQVHQFQFFYVVIAFAYAASYSRRSRAIAAHAQPERLIGPARSPE